MVLVKQQQSPGQIQEHAHQVLFAANISRAWQPLQRCTSCLLPERRSFIASVFAARSHVQLLEALGILVGHFASFSLKFIPVNIRKVEMAKRERYTSPLVSQERRCGGAFMARLYPPKYKIGDVVVRLVAQRADS